MTKELCPTYKTSSPAFSPGLVQSNTTSCLEGCYKLPRRPHCLSSPLQSYPLPLLHQGHLFTVEIWPSPSWNPWMTLCFSKKCFKIRKQLWRLSAIWAPGSSGDVLSFPLTRHRSVLSLSFPSGLKLLCLDILSSVRQACLSSTWHSHACLRIGTAMQPDSLSHWQQRDLSDLESRNESPLFIQGQGSHLIERELGQTWKHSKP